MSGSVVAILLAGAALCAWIGQRNGYDAFLIGAREGMETAGRVLPTLCAMMCAVAMVRASGLIDVLEKVFSLPLSFVGIPKELTGLILVRPLSGSAALGVLAELFERYGPDSAVGRMASVMMGSTETVFYTAALYFGSVGIRKSRYTIPAALISMAAGTLAAALLCRIVPAS